MALKKVNSFNRVDSLSRGVGDLNSGNGIDNHVGEELSVAGWWKVGGGERGVEEGRGGKEKGKWGEKGVWE